MDIANVVIIGSGPAAWTAALYAARANLDPVLVEGAMTEENRLAGTLPMGQLNLTTEVENFPGFPEGITGPVLMQNMVLQAKKYGVKVLSNDVIKLDIGKCTFTHTLDSGEKLVSRTVIVATGASAKYLDIPGEEEFKNNGVSACAVCDGALPRFRNQPVAVVGGGDSACEEALYLSKFASFVYLIHRRDKLRASKIMQDKVLNHPKIHIIWDSVVSEVLGSPENGVEQIEIHGEKATQWKQVAGLFVAIGHRPNTFFLPKEVGLDENGFIRTLSDFKRKTSTTVPGIFAAGDVADPNYRQAITAAGDGCRAALDVERYLELS